MSRLLDGIQDHYTFAQPGVQRMVSRLQELVHRVDKPLHDHIDAMGVQFMSFAFRWMNCLLMREVSLSQTIRMWDTYLCEKGGFDTFHVYACAAFLTRFSAELRSRDFQDLMLFLQSPPTQQWSPGVIDELLSQAFLLSSLYDGASSHLQQ